MCFLRPPHSWFNLLKSGFVLRKSLHSQKKFTVVYMTLPPDDGKQARPVASRVVADTAEMVKASVRAYAS